MRLGKCLGVVFALAACVAGAGVSQAGIIASSTFDAGSQGWLVADLTYPAVGSPPPVLGTYSPSWSSTGGNPGGYISILDPTGNVFYWSAPGEYLGNQSAAYGGSLEFDLAVTGNGYGSPPGFDQEDVVLVGAGRTLVYDTGFSPAPTSIVSWNSFSVGLSETGWRLNGLGGPAATQADMQATLGSLGAVYIRGEYLFGLDDVGRLDNIALSSPVAAAVPEPSSILLFALGGVALAGRRRYRRRQSEVAQDA